MFLERQRRSDLDRWTRRGRMIVRTEWLCWVWCVKKSQIDWCFLGRKRTTGWRDRRPPEYLSLLRRSRCLLLNNKTRVT
jgi:hypothetical protein